MAKLLLGGKDGISAKIKCLICGNSYKNNINNKNIVFIERKDNPVDSRNDCE